MRNSLNMEAGGSAPARSVLPIQRQSAAEADGRLPLMCDFLLVIMKSVFIIVVYFHRFQFTFMAYISSNLLTTQRIGSIRLVSA